jgi:DNA primase
MLEHFRDSPHGQVLARLAGESLDGEFDEQVVESLFQDTLEKLRQGHARQEFALLTEKARSRGLNPEELARYRELLRAGKEPLRPPTVSDS